METALIVAAAIIAASAVGVGASLKRLRQMKAPKICLNTAILGGVVNLPTPVLFRLSVGQALKGRLLQNGAWTEPLTFTVENKSVQDRSPLKMWPQNYLVSLSAPEGYSHEFPAPEGATSIVMAVLMLEIPHSPEITTY